MQILHVIDNLGAGGPARSMLSFIKHAPWGDQAAGHTVVSLNQSLYMPLVFAARRLGAELLRAPDRQTLSRLVQSSDVVLLHFWNTPLIWDYLAFAPQARTVVWSKVLGVSFPQTINKLLVQRAARFVPTGIPAGQVENQDRLNGAAADVVPGLTDFERLKNVTKTPHDAFNVDYVGTLSAGKIHRNYVQIMSGIDIPQMSARAFGGKPDQWLLDQVSSAENPDRFQFPGFVEDIRKIFCTSDVFGYPLAPDTYATSDKSLQEAMYAGVPPVIFPHGGIEGFVQDGQTGIVARSESEFQAAVEWLYRHPDKRIDMGRKAHEFARTQFDPVPHAERLMETILGARHESRTAMLERPRQTNAGSLFLMSHGFEEADAISAVQMWNAGEPTTLDSWVLQLTEGEVSVEGGLYHWYKHFADTAAIAWWTAISLAAHGRLKRAAKVMDAMVYSGPLPGNRASAQDLIIAALNQPGGEDPPQTRKRHARFVDDLRDILSGRAG